MNAPGAAGNYYGADTTAQGDAAERKPALSTSSPLADRTVNPSGGEPGLADRTGKMPGGVENLSASTRSQWVPGGEGEAVTGGRE